MEPISYRNYPKSTEFVIIINSIKHCVLYIVDCKTGTLPTSYLLEHSLENKINSLPWKRAQSSEFSDSRMKNKCITLNKMFLFAQSMHPSGLLQPKMKENVVWGSACFGREPTNCHKNATSQQSSGVLFFSLFKLFYRFHVHESRLKLQTKYCLKSLNPRQRKLYHLFLSPLLPKPMESGSWLLKV